MKFLNDKSNKKMKQKLVSIIKNSDQRKDENARCLHSILTYFIRMDSYYPFFAFLYHYTKYRYSWVIEEIDDDFTLKLMKLRKKL